MGNKLHMGITSVALAVTVGCSSLPGNDEQQGAVIGGATGAAVGAAVTENRVLGAIIGGAVGAAGGYVVGANKDKILGKDKEGASEAARKSQETPATAEQARTATTADVNSDGFVTLDEVIALDQAGLTDEQIVQRLRSTGQVFDLTEEQRRYLREKGVSESVINQMATLNQDKINEIPRPSDPVIGRPGNTI